MNVIESLKYLPEFDEGIFEVHQDKNNIIFHTRLGDQKSSYKISNTDPYCAKIETDQDNKYVKQLKKPNDIIVLSSNTEIDTLPATDALLDFLARSLPSREYTHDETMDKGNIFCGAELFNES